MDQWKSILQPRLSTGANELAQLLAAEDSKTTKAEAKGEAYAKVIGTYAATANSNDIRQLHLVADVCVVARTVAIAKQLLTPSSQRLSGIARNNTTVQSISNVSGVTAPQVAGVKGRLFEREPTACICGLIEAGTITAPSPAVKTAAVSVLSSAIDAGFNIGKQSILSLNLPSDPDLRRYLSTIQRLQMLVANAEQIEPLRQAGFKSAHDIAGMTASAVANTLRPKGLQDDASYAIFNQAYIVDSRNERLWVDFIRQRDDIPALSMDAAPSEPAPATADVSWSNLFKEVDAVEVDELSSVLSPAAYLVDLLQTLRYSTLSFDDPTTGRLLEEFLKRRPDIQRIVLSKANTLVPVKYLDLVNEVLESYIGRTIMGGTLEVYEEDDQDEVALGRTQWSVYQMLQPRVFPMSFPFNYASKSMQENLLAIQCPMSELYRLFQEGSSASLARRRAAAVLGLGPELFVAITGEAFQSFEAMSESRDVFLPSDYTSKIGLATAAEYWGFQTSDKLKGPDGITKIEAELLPRSQLSFNELLDVLKTEFMAKRLVVNVENTNGYYSERLADMRLRGSLSDMSEESCFALQSFIRLWRALGWPMSEVDAAAATFASIVPGKQNYKITPYVIECMAATKQLSDFSGRDIESLVPLWGDMRNPLFQKIFCQPALVRLCPVDLSVSATITQNYTAVMLSLGLSLTEADYMVKAANLSPTDVWTLENASGIYRHHIMRKLLDIEASEYASWLSLFPEPFSSPMTTLDIVKRWKAIDLKVLEVINYTDPRALQVAADALISSSAVQKAFPTQTSLPTEFSTERLLALCALFGPAKLGPFVEGSMVVSVAHSAGRPNISSAKVECTATTLTMKCMLTDAEKISLTQASSNATWVAAVNKAYAEFSDLYSILKVQLLESSLTFLFNLVDTSDPAITEAAAYDRRRTFMLAAIPVAIARRVRENTQAAFANLFPIDRDALNYILESRYDYFRDLQTRNAPYLSQTGSRGYLISPATADFYFRGTANLTVGGTTVSLPGSASLVQGQAYPINFGASKPELMNMSTSAGTADLNFLHYSIKDEISSIVSQVGAVAKVVEQAKLSVAELRYFGATSMTFPVLESISAYAKLRDSLTGSLLDFLQSDATVDMLSQLTSWPVGRINEYIAIKPDTGLFRDHKRIAAMIETLQFAEQIPVPLQTLANWASLQQDQWAQAKEVQRAIGARASSANDKLAKLKRDVLLQYLMSQPALADITKDGVDGLFQYFLIDVQMGPQQETSRISQAISTIQYFVQRCLLGLETRNGIPTTAVDKKRWSWMSRFNMWQANRKVFLYPENWIEPSLRDDKSDVFKEIESIIQQTSLNSTSINELFRRYIYRANETADLEVQAYFWEGADSFRGSYHIIARTRTSPYRFYYRVLKITGVKQDVQNYNWWPWTKIDVDIVPLEADWDGRPLKKPGLYIIPSIYRGRLFLFIPQLVLRQRRAALPDMTYQAMANAKIETKNTSYWEMKMAWTEYQNGAWSKKEISAGYLEIEGVPTPSPNPTSIPSEAAAMPSAESFQFRVTARSPADTDKGTANAVNLRYQELLVIDVFRIMTSTGGSVQFHIGRFELRGTQMVLSDYRETGTNNKRTLPTKFGKFDVATTSTTVAGLQTDMAAMKQYNQNANRDDGPILALPPQTRELDLNPKQNLTWTVSYNESQFRGALALVLERITSARTDSYFGLPSREADGSIASATVTGIQRLTHDIAQPLMEVATNSDDLRVIFKIMEDVPNNMCYDAFGATRENIGKELATPNSIYNWELGFHLVLYLFERLKVTQQYDLALEVANMVFDPKGDDKVQTGNKAFILPGTAQTEAAAVKAVPNLERAWKFPPFKSSRLRMAGSMKRVVETLRAGVKQSDDVQDWLANPFNPHSIARQRPAIYMKRLVITYIEIIVAEGDNFFRQDTLESISLAMQKYLEASLLFGAKPITLPRPTKAKKRCYQDMLASLNDFGNASVDLELYFPYYIEPSDRARTSATRYSGVIGMVQSPYFSIPPNPQVAALRELIDDRFYKIRNSLDIDGNERKLALFEPPLDPADLVRGAAGGGSSFRSVSDGPMPLYRFKFLVDKAKAICAELRDLGNDYLAIKEKRDGERLNSLVARQNTVMEGLAMEIKTLGLKEAKQELEVLQGNREQLKMKLEYYLALIGESGKVPGPDKEWTDIRQSIYAPTKDALCMNPMEKTDVDLSRAALNLSNNALALLGAAAPLSALPAISINTEPLGLGQSTEIDLGKIATALEFGSNIMVGSADNLKGLAERAARANELMQQLQERRLEANTAGRDIKIVDKQIESQRTRISIAEAEIAAQRTQMANVQQMQDYLANKYTNEALYAWHESKLFQIFSDSYDIALQVAKSAEKALAYERNVPGTLSSHWDSKKDGAVCAQGLSLDLKKLELAYQKRRIDFEISKDFSLRTINPWTLLRLHETGKINFSLPEILYDYDFPGHYCRRIKAVSVSFVGASPCAMLRLQEHAYRLRQTGSTYYPELIDIDDRYRTDKVPIASIAVSGQSDGQFDASFDGDTYAPFEGAGAISKWILELPPVRQVDYRSITDVVINVKYTALEGGAVWRKAASEAVSASQRDAAQEFYALFDLGGCFTGTNGTLRNIKSQLPAWAQTNPVFRQLFLSASPNISLTTAAKINNKTVSVSSKQGGATTMETVAVNEVFDEATFSVPSLTTTALQQGKLWFLIRFGLQ